MQSRNTGVSLPDETMLGEARRGEKGSICRRTGTERKRKRKNRPSQNHPIILVLGYQRVEMARLWVLLCYSHILYVFSGLASDRSPRQRKSWRHAVVVTNKLIILETETETAREMLTFTKKDSTS